MSENPYRSLVPRLRQLIEDLDGIAFDELREAAAGGAGRPDADKRAVRARRSLEKALALLDDRGINVDD